MGGGGARVGGARQAGAPRGGGRRRGDGARRRGGRRAAPRRAHAAATSSTFRSVRSRPPRADAGRRLLGDGLVRAVAVDIDRGHRRRRRAGRAAAAAAANESVRGTGFSTAAPASVTSARRLGLQRQRGARRRLRVVVGVEVVHAIVAVAAARLEFGGGKWAARPAYAPFHAPKTIRSHASIAAECAKSESVQSTQSRSRSWRHAAVTFSFDDFLTKSEPSTGPMSTWQSWQSSRVTCADQSSTSTVHSRSSLSSQLCPRTSPSRSTSRSPRRRESFAGPSEVFSPAVVPPACSGAAEQLGARDARRAGGGGGASARRRRRGRAAAARRPPLRRDERVGTPARGPCHRGERLVEELGQRRQLQAAHAVALDEALEPQPAHHLDATSRRRRWVCVRRRARGG